MLIIDAHLDLAWNALFYDRDLRCSAHEIRAHEQHTPGPFRAAGTVGLPDLRRGRVAVSVVTLLARAVGPPVESLCFRSWSQAYASNLGQLAYYEALEQEGLARLLTTRDEFNRHWAEWESWDAAHPGSEGEGAPPLGFVLSMEGADSISGPDRLQEWWDRGLRLIGITHYGPGRYAGGTHCEDGLSHDGPAFLKLMDRLGFGFDLTHCCDAAFWQAIEHFHGPVLASHNNCRALVPGQRQFSDDQLRVIIERDGVIGAVFDTWMLEPNFVKGVSTNQGIGLEKVVDQIDHVCQLAGNARHAAIGSDLDGLFGLEQSPCDLDTIADLQRIAELLTSRGYAPDDVAAVMHGNWKRLLMRCVGP